MSISHKHINQIAPKLAVDYLGAPINDIRLIQGKGEVNQVYEIITTANKAVLRVNDYAEFYRFKKEEWCIKQARTNGIPTPNIYMLGTMKNALIH